MKNTIGNLLLRFYKSEIISKLYSLTFISIRKTWIGDVSLKRLRDAIFYDNIWLYTFQMCFEIRSSVHQ